MKRELTFRFITPGGDEVLPVAGYFSLGDAESVNRNIDGEFEIYQNPKRRKQHAVVATGDGVVNVGRTFGAEHAGTQPCRYVVAVVDHERGTAQLADVLGGRIVRLEPRLPGLPYEAKQEYGELDMSERASVLDHKKRLVAAFGSTRRARNMNRAEATKQASQHVRGADALLETVAQLGEAALQQGATMAQVEARLAQQRNLPPHHPDATSPRQAYRMSELVPESLRSQLYHADLQAAAASASQLQQLRRDGLVTAYVLGRISTLTPDSTAPPTDDRAVALAAVDALSWLYLRSPSRITARDGRAPDGGNLRQHLGQGLLQALLTLFYTTTHEGSSTVYERTTKQKELLLRWLLALALLAEPMASLEPDGVSALANQLHMPPTELVKRFRELGCVCSVAGGRGDAQTSFSVKLLPDGSRGKPLSSFLQRIVRPAVRGRG